MRYCSLNSAHLIPALIIFIVAKGSYRQQHNTTQIKTLVL